jgi:predicted dienelactone hydrolase
MARRLLPSIFIVVSACGQRHATAPRSDGRQTPLTIYAAKGATGCAPLAIISHGAGGSENGYRYLAQAFSENGFTTIVMGHRESGLAALGSDMRASGVSAGVEQLVEDADAERARLLDVSAALKFADSQCNAPFRVLAGHSMGAVTVMLEAGARNTIQIDSPPAGADRFDAYVAFSPEGPGVVFSEHAWTGIQKPMLILTGTRDQSLKGGPQTRQIAWRELPGIPSNCQWMGVIDGATHMNFAGSGPGADRVDRLVTRTLARYLEGARVNTCAAPPAESGMTLRAK